MNLVRFLFILIVAVLINLVGCGRNPKEDSAKSKNTASNKISDTLKQNKVDSLVVDTDKLIVGKTYLGDDLLKVIDKHFPGAIFSPDESIQIISGGDTYIIQTKKLNYSGPAYYEIVSITVKK